MKPQEFEECLGVELKKEPSLEQLVRYDSKNSYTLDENGDVIGLNVCGNELTDGKVAFLWELPELQALNLSENQLSAVSIPAGMKSLVHLNISENSSLDKVSFEGGLSALEVLNLGECALTEIHFPEGFTALHTAYLQKNKIVRTTFDGGCPNLKLLDLSGNQLESFALSAGFEKLERLYLNDNKINSLELGDSLPALDTLHLRNNQLDDLPEVFLEPFPELVSLYLYGNPLPDAIEGTVEINEYQNNLPFIKEYMEELSKGKVQDNECKILLVGNGNVGKSCLVKRLKENEFEPEWKSTHGIVLKQYKHKEYTFNIWDFGGQDIYHATHRLFMQSNAVYLILWDADTENRRFTPINEHGEDKEYDNFILEYWLDYAIHLGKGSPAIVVQTKTGRDGKKDLPQIREAYESRLSYLDFQHIESDENDWDENGYKDLLTSIRRAVKRTKTKTNIPEGWAKVRRALRDKQEAGEKKLGLADYLSLAKDLENSISVLENWLVKTGVVFYRKGLFQDEIILDQQWAIDAIYTIFNRKANLHYKVLYQKGNFSGQDLEEDIWAEKTEKERELLISFMLSCEICFETSQRNEKWPHLSFTERTFVAPQLLESKKPERFQNYWDGISPLHLRYRQEFLHYGVIQRFIVRTQSKANVQDIWKYGLLLREGEQKAEVEATEREIHVQVTKDGKDLLDKIRNLLENLQDGKGEESVSVDGNNYVLLEELKKLPQNVPSIQNRDGEWIDVAPLNIFRNKDEWAIFKEEALEDKLPHSGMEGIRMAEFEPSMEKASRKWSGGVPYGRASGYYKKGFGEEPSPNNPGKILFIAANPTDQSRTQTDKEHRILKAELRAGQYRDRYTFLQPQFSVTIGELLRARNENPYLVHFSGHGSKDGIIITTGNNLSQKMSVEALQLLFRPLQGITQIVILNACYSADQAKVISEYGIFVVGNNLPVKDAAAIGFSKGFYNGLGEGKPFEEAFNDAMTVIFTEYPSVGGIIEVWKDGYKLDLKD